MNVSVRDRSQRGFTLMEVLVALVVFAVSVVGLVALESRSLEAQRAAADMREAERIAQDAMAELLSTSYMGLVNFDFAGNLAPAFPYRDHGENGLDPSLRLRDFRRPPADLPANERVVGSITGKFLVFREVDSVIDPNNAAIPSALVLQVSVLWIDDSNSGFPPPAGFTTDELTLADIDTTNAANFRPYVGSVQLRRVRVNDAAP